jgi:hypothetical protein
LAERGIRDEALRPLIPPAGVAEESPIDAPSLPLRVVVAVVSLLLIISILYLVTFI